MTRIFIELRRPFLLICIETSMGVVPGKAGAQHRPCLAHKHITNMSASPEIRVWAIRPALVFATLAISVFLWGLGYKLSLYEPTKSAIHSIPTAKLFSESERIKLDGIALGGSVKTYPLSGMQTALWTAILLCWILVTASPLSRTEMQASFFRRHGSRKVRAQLHAFLFRPPPCAFCVPSQVVDN